MIFTAFADGRLRSQDRWMQCALGRAGVVPAALKTEGDGASPAGLWPLRRVLWRADRLAAPPTRLPAAAIRQGDGWCDDPADPNYNRPVSWPYHASAERLWREDGVYDLIVVLGYNDAPVRPQRGSAIFVHVARPGFSPTEGCVALAASELLTLLAVAAPGDALEIRIDPSPA
jgi:L,D-peptidoglycan transpeptidase YkuD (ErfK/YbiS/YcfS/YnhG family)